MYRFGVFELDERATILTRQGQPVRLPRQSIVMLHLLVQRPGEVVTRAELARALWPSGLHVDFEHGINNAAARLRRALGDPAIGARLVETLPRVGYRFITPVTRLPDAPTVHTEAATVLWRQRSLVIAAASIAVFASGWLLGAVMTRPGPSDARAFAERSLIHTRLVLDGDLPANLAYGTAAHTAAQALRLDPDLAEAQLAAGYVALWGRWDWASADRLFRSAIARDPQSAPAHQARALWLAGRGRSAEALTQIARARRLDPGSIRIAHDEALLAFVAGDAPASVRFLSDVLDRRPDDAAAHELMSEALASLGRNAEAATHFYRFLVLADVDEQDARDATGVLATGGMVSLIRRNMARPSTKPLDRPGVAFKVASNHAVIGNVDDALTWLHRATAQRDSRLLLVNVHPRFALVRSDPRFRSVLAAVGL